MISSTEGILFECPKVVTISENISLYVLRKTIMDAVRGCKISLDLFYHQPVYIGDSCVEEEYMELTRDKYFSSFQNLVTKV